MRKRFSVALIATIFCLAGMTRDAGATVTFNLVWTATTGAGITGTDTIAAAPGDQITLSIVMTNDQTLIHSGVSLAFDTDLGNELNIVNGANWHGTTFGSMTSVTTYGPIAPAGTKQAESTGASAGAFYAYNSGAFTGPGSLPLGTYTIGTLKFTANASASAQPDGPDVWVGLFYTDVDVVLNNLALPIAEGSLVFGTAAVTTAVIPEPSTACLVGLGFVSLVLAARRSRR